MTTSFNVRASIGITTSKGIIYLQLSNIPQSITTKYTEWITTTDLINATVFIITQKILVDGRTVHYIRCGSKFIAKTYINNTQYLVLVNQPQYWYLTNDNTIIPTESIVDLLEYQPFYITSPAGETWAIIANGQANVVSLLPLIQVNKLCTLVIYEQTQPIVYSTRYILVQQYYHLHYQAHQIMLLMAAM